MAASESHFYSDAFAKIDGALTDFVLGAASNVIGAFSPVARTLLILYVILWGWAIMRSMITEPIMDGLFRIVRLSIITGIALQLANYNEFVVNILWKTPEALAGVLAQGSGDNVPKAQYLDASWSKFYDYGALYFANGSFMHADGWGLIIVAFLIWACGIIVTGYAAVLLIMAKIALALLLALGPLFILTAIFEATKQFFNAWVGQALNAVFLIVLTSGIITLVIGVVESVLANSLGATEFVQPSMQMALALVIMSFIAFVIMMQLPSISAALGGGLALSTLGTPNRVYDKLTNSAGRLLEAARPANMRRTLNRARADVKAVRDTGTAIAGAPKAMYRKITTRKNRVARG